MSEPKVMLVTGASKGIGLATVIQALKGGYAVAATSRNVDRLAAEVAQAARISKPSFYHWKCNLKLLASKRRLPR